MYENLLKADSDNVFKAGKTLDYCGGSVFETYEQAFDYKTSNKLDEYEIYGVLADWEDTESNVHGLFHNLLVDSRLVKIKEGVIV